jgi:CBS-domain-containing membrane protein
MSKTLYSITPDTPLPQAAQMMTDLQLRRLPVVDEDGSLKGLVTLARLAKDAAGPSVGEAKGITPDAVGATLASVSQRPPVDRGVSRPPL